MSATAASVSPLRPEIDTELRRVFDLQQTASREEPPASLAVRIDRLNRLESILVKYEEDIINVISADFGHRAEAESRMLDVVLALGDIKETRRHLKRWMAPRRAPARLHLKPAYGRVAPQPLGVVGIITPWNFPVLLAFHGIAAALAAGNRAMLKPSELTPATSELLASALAEVFREDEVAVVLGSSEVGAAFSALPFDHLLFTGSTRVGRHVAKAAAKNLTPVTLELGGKSPVVVAPSADTRLAAEKIVYGKMINAGQICIAADYALAPRSRIDALVEEITRVAGNFYPTLGSNPDYTSIITDEHYERLCSLVEDARAKGAEIVEINPFHEEQLAKRRKFPLTLVINPTDNMKVLQEEIFGPILPIVAYDRLPEAVRYINDRDRPLALYVFATAASEQKLVLECTVSGGAAVNDVVWHFAYDSMPFGGVGPSGMGAYHGRAGFDTFSHLKPILYQPRVNAIPLFYPPYGQTMSFLGKFLRKFM